jgi:hypothetical protein
MPKQTTPMISPMTLALSIDPPASEEAPGGAEYSLG